MGGRGLKMINEKLSTQQYKAISLMIQSNFSDLNSHSIADRVGVSVRTLERWKTKEEFQVELMTQTQKLMNEFILTAYAELRKLISDPNVSDSNRLKAIRLYLTSYGLLKNTEDSNINTAERSPGISFEEYWKK